MKKLIDGKIFSTRKTRSIFIGNMDAEPNTEILSSKIEGMRILCSSKVILQFDNYLKHKIFHAYKI